MSTRLHLDGPDLPALVAQVRDEYGPDARIVRAERVRTGGIAGFFASEHYELTIEVSGPPAAPGSILARARARAAAGGVLASGERRPRAVPGGDGAGVAAL